MDALPTLVANTSHEGNSSVEHGLPDELLNTLSPLRNGGEAGISTPHEAGSKAPNILLPDHSQLGKSQQILLSRHLPLAFELWF